MQERSLEVLKEHSVCRLDGVKGEDEVLSEEIKVFQDRRRERLLRFSGADCVVEWL